MKFVIWSIEHRMWWRANHLGYAETLAEAGVYDVEATTEILARANVVKTNECAIPLGALKDANVHLLVAIVEDDLR